MSSTPPKKPKKKKSTKKKSEIAERLSGNAQVTLFEMQLLYVTDPERRSLEWWYEEYSVHFNLDTARKFSEENKWIDQRKSYWNGVKDMWLRQKQQALIQMRTDELREATDLKDAVLDFCKPKVLDNGQTVWPIKPKSYEGLITAFVQLDDLVENKRQSISDEIEPMLDAMAREEAVLKGGARKKHETPFDRNEMRMLAHKILGKRRTERRAAINIQDDDSDETKEAKDIIDIDESSENGVAS